MEEMVENAMRKEKMLFDNEGEKKLSKEERLINDLKRLGQIEVLGQ